MSLIEEVLADPTDVSMLKIDGNDLMLELHMKPGPILGKILHILLEMCIEDPSINEKTSLLDSARIVLKKTDREIDELYLKALHTKQEENQQKIKRIRDSHRVI